MEKFLPACLAAGVVGLSVSSASAALSAADREFAMKAASGGLAEVQAAQLAEQRATSPQISLDFRAEPNTPCPGAIQAGQDAATDYPRSIRLLMQDQRH